MSGSLGDIFTKFTKYIEEDLDHILSKFYSTTWIDSKILTI